MTARVTRVFRLRTINDGNGWRLKNRGRYVIEIGGLRVDIDISVVSVKLVRAAKIVRPVGLRFRMALIYFEFLRDKMASCAV